jgi:hypothetical protein
MDYDFRSFWDHMRWVDRMVNPEKRVDGHRGSPGGVHYQNRIHTKKYADGRQKTKGRSKK